MLRVLDNSTGSMRCYMQFGRTRFGAALLHRQRANGPAIYLAQSEGLGFYTGDLFRAEGPSVKKSTAAIWEYVNGQALALFFPWKR